MLFNLVALIFFALDLVRAQKTGLKVNIREIPLNPFNSSDVLEIGVMLFIIDLEAFKELEMDFRIDYLMRQVWWPHSNFCLAFYDNLEISPTRKKPFKPVILYEPSDLENLWLPDTFASNSKDERLSSDTDSLEMVILAMVNDKKCIIEYWTKLNAKLSCSLNFRYYPFDAVNEKLLRYKWIKRDDNDYQGFKNDELVFLTDGVVLMYPFRFTHYEIEAFSNHYKDDLYFRFSALYVTFIYKRKIFGHFITIYLPSSLLLLVAWSSFWIDIDEVGRVLNCMTCFLSLLTQFIHVRSELPVLSYVNSLEIWMLACLTFIFLNLLQFTIVKYIQSNTSAHNLASSRLARRKSSLSDEQALNGYLMQKNRERFQVIKKLRSLNRRDKSAKFKQTELVKYLAVSKIPGKEHVTNSNQRLPFVSKRNIKELNHKAFLSNDEHYQTTSDRLLSFERADRNNNYDRVLRERIERLVKHDSSSSSSSDSESEEEESWFQKAKQDREVKDLINKIDYYSRITLLIAFQCFNLTYWLYMLISSAKK